jgi:hypothetical protein
VEEDRNAEEPTKEVEALTTAEPFTDRHELVLESDEAPPEEHGYGHGV